MHTTVSHKDIDMSDIDEYDSFGEEDGNDDENKQTGI